jgi:hypothetical protein
MQNRKPYFGILNHQKWFETTQFGIISCEKKFRTMFIVELIQNKTNQPN